MRKEAHFSRTSLKYALPFRETVRCAGSCSMLPTLVISPLRAFCHNESRVARPSRASFLDRLLKAPRANRALVPPCVTATQTKSRAVASGAWMGIKGAVLRACSQKLGVRHPSKCSYYQLRPFHSHPQARNTQKSTKGKHREALVGPDLVYKAKWDVYTPQQVESAWYASSEALGSKWGKGISPVVSNGPSRTPPVSEGCDAGGLDRKRQLETDGQEQILLLRHVWEQQGQLSPFQAADLAYFIARRKNPPERLLHQLVSHVLHSHPERRLSVLRIHRLLRVFQLVPGVAERDVLGPLCGALQRRASLLNPADLQLLLSDFSAIYTPQFLPFFCAAARVLKQCRGGPLESPAPAEGPAALRVHEAVEAATSGSSSSASSASSASSNSSSFRRIKAFDCREEGLSPVQACFLLHALGRTDFRDSALFSMLVETVDGAVSQLLVYGHQQERRRQRLDTSVWMSHEELLLKEDPEAFPGAAGEPPRCGGLWQAAAELTGEALVMCAKGLANLNYKPTSAQLRRLVEVLVPYLLCEEPSVLGHAPSARRLPLVFGAVSGLTRLGAGPEGLRRLIEEVCSQPLKAMGPYEPCDLLAAAAALEPVAALPPDVAAAAIRTLEANLLQGMSPAEAARTLSELASAAPKSSAAATTAATAGVASSAVCDVAGVGGDAMETFRARTVSEDDPWASVEDARLSPCSPFRSAANCYLLTVAVGLARIRPFLFALHPAFRVSTLNILASLEALVTPAHRPPSKMASVRQQQQQQQEQQNQQQQRQQPKPLVNYSIAQQAASGGMGTSDDAVGTPRQQAPHCNGKQAQHVSTKRGLSAESGGRGRPPLHPVLRHLILSLFYRLPCLSLRLLVEFMDALRVCDFAQREQTEGLFPHGKNSRWHRPLMHALAREAVRKMHQATADSVVKFLALFYVELDGYEVSLGPLIYGMHRLALLGAPNGLSEAEALRRLLMVTTMKPEGAAAFSSFSSVATQLAAALVSPSRSSD